MKQTEALLLSLCLAPTLTPAVAVRHDRDETLFEQLGREFPSTVMLRHGDGKGGLGGEGTLVQRNWVLTAAHVASDLGPGDPATILGKIYRIERVVIYPDSEYIEFDDPETVIGAVRDVYDQARKPLAARD